MVGYDPPPQHYRPVAAGDASATRFAEFIVMSANNARDIRALVWHL
jgi:hypothetical protein